MPQWAGCNGSEREEPRANAPLRLYGNTAIQPVDGHRLLGERILGSGQGLMLRSERHSLLLALAVLATFGATAARALAQTRPGVVRVEWKAANILVYPDTAAGVTMWMATNAHARVGGRPLTREIIEHFHPDSLRDWLVYTRQLLTLREPLSGDTLPIVSSGLVRGADGTAIAAGRRRKKRELDRLTRLAIAPREGEALLFDLDRSDVDTLLDAFEAAAAQSAVVSRQLGTPAASLGKRVTAASPDLHERPPKYPPDRLAHHQEGEVWLTFVVGADGVVDPSSIVVYLSDHPAFEASVRDYFRVTPYIPATVDGQPVRMLTQQRFVFSIAR
jgi:TonB family protein